MNLEKAVEILEHYNRWRRDENIPNSLEMVNPAELGRAIDLVTVELRMHIVGVAFKGKKTPHFKEYLETYFVITKESRYKCIYTGIVYSRDSAFKNYKQKFNIKP